MKYCTGQFSPSQNRKWITAKWLTHGKPITRGSCVRNAYKTPLLTNHFNIYFEFRSKRSLITVIWMDPHSPTSKKSLRQNIVFSYPEMIPVSFSFFLCLFLYFSFLCYVMLCYLFCYCKFLQKLFSIYCSFYYLLLLLILLFY